MASRHSWSKGGGSLKRKVLPLLALALVLAVGGFLLLGADRSKRDGPDSAQEAPVEINGVLCRPKKNLRTFLFMGIDNTEQHTDDYNIGGQADVLLLLVLDKTHGQYYQLDINRNTMTEIHSFDDDGNDIGTSVAQISYSHMQGGGGALSCENTCRAVSDLLMGQKIDGYVALSMYDIGKINHVVGGVSVTIEDDFSREDPSLVMGQTIKLTDEQAEHFIRGRMSVGDGTNEGRMRRQKAYVDGMKANMLELQKENDRYALEVYESLQGIMDTNLTDKDFSRIARGLLSCETQGEFGIEGTIGVDHLEQATLEPDPDKLADTVIDIFYHRVEQ